VWRPLGLLLGQAGLGRDEAQRGGVRVLVDLVEVVLQDLHLVLGGAARGVRRHGLGAVFKVGELQRHFSSLPLTEVEIASTELSVTPGVAKTGN